MRDARLAGAHRPGVTADRLGGRSHALRKSPDSRRSSDHPIADCITPRRPNSIHFSPPLQVKARRARTTRDGHFHSTRLAANGSGSVGGRGDALAEMPLDKPRAQLAFKDSMIRGILQFTLRIAFRCVLHRCKSQDIRC